MDYESSLLKTEDNLPEKDKETIEAEKKFAYFFTKLGFQNGRKNSQLRKSSMDGRQQGRISELLGINENNKDPSLLNETSYTSKKASNTSINSLNNTQYQTEPVTKPSKDSINKVTGSKNGISKVKTDKNDKKPVKGNNNTKPTTSKKPVVTSNNKNKSSPNNKGKGTSSSVPKNNAINNKLNESVENSQNNTKSLNNTSSSLTENEKRVSINEIPEVHTLNKRGSVTAEQIKAGSCKYEFLINEFGKVFGENLENYDERGNF